MNASSLHRCDDFQGIGQGGDEKFGRFDEESGTDAEGVQGYGGEGEGYDESCEGQDYQVREEKMDREGIEMIPCKRSGSDLACDGHGG